jgi:ABC-type glycerol-3-phosphate transport system permease component
MQAGKTSVAPEMPRDVLIIVPAIVLSAGWAILVCIAVAFTSLLIGVCTGHAQDWSRWRNKSLVLLVLGGIFGSVVTVPLLLYLRVLPAYNW